MIKINKYNLYKRLLIFDHIILYIGLAIIFYFLFERTFEAIILAILMPLGAILMGDIMLYYEINTKEINIKALKKEYIQNIYGLIEAFMYMVFPPLILLVILYFYFF